MIKAELIYNPYLLETEVRFNGNPPMINSLVQKYKYKKLQTWINEIPSIFHDEMNGYDFELDFTGTKLDYEELKKAFELAGVNEEKVKLFHKGVIADRNDKVSKIDDLIQWLTASQNRRFDSSTFLEKRKELFDGAYPFILIGSPFRAEKIFENIDISAENVDSADELTNTNLKSTPILIYLDISTSRSLQHNLKKLREEHPEIIDEQLFFMIVPELRDKIGRIIRDLGVKNPKIVDSLNSKEILQYIEIFPVTDYIHDVIQELRGQTDKIEPALKVETIKTEATNADAYRIIRQYDDFLGRAKSAYDLFSNRDNLDLPLELTKARFNLSAAINRWNNKKTKITNAKEARSLAAEFEKEVCNQFKKFANTIHKIYVDECDSIRKKCTNWYKDSKLMDYDTSSIKPKWLSEYSVPSFTNELLNIKKERYVDAKEAFLDKLFKGSGVDNTQDMVLETTFYCDKWRAYGITLLEPITDRMVQETYTAIQDYYNRLSESYLSQLSTLIKQATENKDKESSKLSSKERELQEDNDWFTAFCDKIRDIERS